MTGKGYNMFLTQIISAVMAIHYHLHILAYIPKRHVAHTEDWIEMMGRKRIQSRREELL